MNMNCEPDLTSAELSQRGPLDGGAGTPSNNGGQGTVSLGATSSADHGTGVSQHHHGSPGDQQHALVRTTMAAQQPCDYGDPKQHGGMDLHLQSGGISLTALTRGDSGAYALSNVGLSLGTRTRHPYGTQEALAQHITQLGGSSLPSHLQVSPTLRMKPMLTTLTSPNSRLPPEWSYYSAGSPSPGVQGPPSGAYVGGPTPDPEPTRCRRTDGKKWRCGRQVVHEQKYCEKHMHRGRHRSQRLRDQADMNHSDHHLNGGSSGGDGGGGGGSNSRPPQHSASTADLISAALGGNSSGTPSLSTISGISIGSLGLQRSHSSVAAAAAVAAAAMAVPLAPIPKASGLHLQLPQQSQGGQGSPLESPRKRPPQSPQGPRPSLSDSGGSRGVKALRYGTQPLLRGGSYDDRLMDLGEQQSQLQRTMSERSFFPSQEAQAAAAAAASDTLLVNQATIQNIGRTDPAAFANAWRSIVVKVPQAPMPSYLQMPDYLQGGAQLVMPSSTAHSSAQQQLRALGGQVWQPGPYLIVQQDNATNSQGSGYASQVQMQLNQQNYGTSNLQTPAQSTSDRSFSNGVDFLPTTNSSQQLSMGDNTGGLSTPDLTASMAAAKVAQARLAGARAPEDDDLQVDAGLGAGPGDDRGQRQSTMWASPLWELGGGLGNPLMEVLQQSSTLRSNKTHHQSSSGNSNQGWGQGFNLLNDTYEMSAPPQSPSRQETAVCHNNNLDTSPRGVLHKPTYGSFSDSSSGSGSPRGQATAAVKTEEAPPGTRDNPTHGLLLESSLV